jgi:adenylate cyclase
MFRLGDNVNSSENLDTSLMTSVDILVKSGISRATLNNYIKMGIIPKPIVRKPVSPDLKAKKIGYFHKDVLDRIYTVQRMKGEGNSMENISKYFLENKQYSQAGHIEQDVDYANRKSGTRDNRLQSAENNNSEENKTQTIGQSNDGLTLTIDNIQCPAF